MGCSVQDDVEDILDGKLYLQAVKVGLGQNPYLPDYKIKNQASRVADNIYWLKKYGEVNPFYYCYQLDRLGLDIRTVKHCISMRRFGYVRRRATVVNRQTAREEKMLKDKASFYQFASSKEIPTPRIFALVEDGRVEWLDGTRENCSLEQLCDYDLTAFCKPVAGLQGQGAFSLSLQGGEVHVNHKPVERASLKDLFLGRYILQEIVVQHDALAMLHAASVNSLRIVTARTLSGKIEPVSVCMRIGVGGRKVDNWAAGGLIVHVDVDAGRLTGSGYFKPGKGGRVSAHPDTNIELDGYKIPYFKEALEICCNAHKSFEFHSIGWDVGILKHGPTILEGNTKWDGNIPMMLDPEFITRFFATVPSAAFGPKKVVGAVTEAKIPTA